MSNLIILTGKDGKKYCVDRTSITGIEHYYYEEKEYRLLIFKKNPCLIVRETVEEVMELIEESEAKEKASIINFIKLTGANDKTDIYVNVDKIGTVGEYTENVRIINVEGDCVLVTETVEEILAKIEEITK